MVRMRLIPITDSSLSWTCPFCGNADNVQRDGSDESSENPNFLESKMFCDCGGSWKVIYSPLAYIKLNPKEESVTTLYPINLKSEQPHEYYD